MKYILVVVAAVALYIVFHYIRFMITLRRSTNPPITQIDREFGSPTSPTLRYIAAGDSTVQGSGASRVENTYPYQVAEFLSANSHVVYKNIGVSGARLHEVVTKQLPTIIAFQPDVITISIGGNDTDRLTSHDEMLANFNTIINTLLAKTSAKIYLATLPNFTGAKLLPAPYIWLIEKHSTPINKALTGFASDRVTIIDVHDFSKVSDIAATYSSDWFHPNDLGYQNWAQAFIKPMKKVIVQ